MNSNQHLNLVVDLATELAVALEMTYDAAELRALWGEAVESLRTAKSAMIEHNLLPPEPIISVIRLHDEG